MLMLAQADAIPGLDLSGVKLHQKLFTQWPWRIFTTTSTKSKSWMQPLLKAVVKSYQDVNVALAQFVIVSPFFVFDRVILMAV